VIPLTSDTHFYLAAPYPEGRGFKVVSSKGELRNLNETLTKNSTQAIIKKQLSGIFSKIHHNVALI